ncbi:hypothetical protein DSCA_38860 [Desulfosarcina alkanivorans]|uniref:DUF1232 domain-containing protein n=1 Tax=Desulfosarcina alkanivorans TaxID=571177 RepID=A0A5K7YL62_9BACT|nr:hypothetical protein DSCA_38860 [Desulfosarcina alkanivorans]
MTEGSGRVDRWKARVRTLKMEVHALLLACRDPRMPWPAKLVAALVVAYAASPIDLIPDFIPVLGYLDDLIILPLGIVLAIKMIPAEVMQDCRVRAGDVLPGTRAGAFIGATVVVVLWIAVIVAVVVFGYKLMGGQPSAISGLLPGHQF